MEQDGVDYHIFIKGTIQSKIQNGDFWSGLKSMEIIMEHLKNL